MPCASLRVDAAQGLELTAEDPSARAQLDERRARLCWPTPPRARVIRCPLVSALPGGPALVALGEALEAARAEGRAMLDADALGIWRGTWAPRATHGAASAAATSGRPIEPHLGWHAMPSVGAARRWALVLPLPRGRIADRGRQLDRTGLEALLALTRADVYFTPRRGVALLGLDDTTRARAEAILEQTGLVGGAP